MPKKDSELEILERAERIRAAITELERQKSLIEASGSVAPPGSYLARYQARGQKHRYWYYQLKASTAIFPKKNQDNEYSRFQHLGKAGSQAHIDGVTKNYDKVGQSWTKCPIVFWAN